MNGLTSIPSDFSVKETIDRIVAILEKKGLTIFARIDHGANAEKAGLTLRPTELIIFGNPRAGTVLMQDNQISGIDLPVKALAWEDETGKVWLSYNETAWLVQRHNLTEKSAGIARDIEQGMRLVMQEASKK
ncbi:MAG: DUF302 domain-containing protein [Bacteroidota bacterium]|nr:DUF302 domain-containing protein [Bacteroidota bacterium]MDP4214515.1 DUF302 domain-containing protein [Bacteroidota bacterium]MDP4248568.1 DUF302 domain-containing protein [Bacteroidota bacterium]